VTAPFACLYAPPRTADLAARSRAWLISVGGQEPTDALDDPIAEAGFAYQVLDPSSPAA
jgi:hypothetical protein